MIKSGIQSLSKVEQSDNLIRGIRYYNIQLSITEYYKDNVYLESHVDEANLYGYNVPWPEIRMAAKCSWYGVDSQVEARNHLLLGCHTCGIYGLYKEDKITKKVFQDNHQMVAMANVIAWGAVVDCEKGWRAETVEIEKLTLFGEFKHRDEIMSNAEIAYAFSKKYNVPIEIKEDEPERITGFWFSFIGPSIAAFAYWGIIFFTNIPWYFAITTLALGNIFNFADPFLNISGRIKRKWERWQSKGGKS